LKKPVPPSRRNSNIGFGNSGMTVRPHLLRFLRKFVFDALPGALASLVGALFFAHQFSQAPQPAHPEAAERIALQSEQFAQMIRDEHALMVEFLKKEQEREAARQPIPIKDMKAREAIAATAASPAPPAPAVSPARRQAEPVREAKAPVAVPPAKPDAEIVALESGPLVAPEPEPEGAFARFAALASAWTDKAVDVTGLRRIPALMRGIPPRADAMTGQFNTLSGANFISASR
jgi:hypothetical protein